MSVAGAMSTSARTRSVPRRRISRASSSASQPPIEEPTTTCGPLVVSNTASVSSSQREIVPSRKSPPDWPWPE